MQPLAADGQEAGLLWVREFVIPASVLDGTLRQLAEVGERQREGFVLWGGQPQRDERRFSFCSAMAPAQTSHITDDGLLVTVDGQGLFEANKFFFQRGETLAAQAHAHPGVAFHSETDDALPLVTVLGGLSLVVPDFARAGRSAQERWAWYRLRGPGDWRPLDEDTRIVIGA